MEQSNSSNKALIGIIVVVLIAVAATAAVVWGTSSTNDNSSESLVSTSPSTSPSPSSEATGESTAYKDGTYSADGSYQTPGGQQSIGVTVTLAGGMITDATVESHASSGESVEYQGRFLDGYKSQVVGKKIDEVSLTRVSGSSLTPNGFNNALSEIESKAQS